MIDFSKYQNEAESYVNKANLLWTKVTGLSVAEVIAGEIDLREVDRFCSQLDSRCSEIRRELSNRVDGLPEEQYDEVEKRFNEVYDLFTLASDKFSAIDNVVTDLRDIKQDYDEIEGDKLFSDVKPIDLGESIKLRRFNYLL